MISAFVILSLSCPKPIVTNKTNNPWNAQDQAHLQRAKIGCRQYYKDAPCLKYFWKRTKSDYDAICGAPKGD